jgi:hypothetical protein
MTTNSRAAIFYVLRCEVANAAAEKKLHPVRKNAKYCQSVNNAVSSSIDISHHF